MRLSAWCRSRSTSLRRLHLDTHRVVEDHEAVAPRGFGVVHGHVRFVDEPEGPVAVDPVGHRHADARRRCDEAAAQISSLAQGAENSRRQRLCFVLVARRLDKDAEFVAAKARDDVVVSHHYPQAIRDRSQKPVARIVAETVVDLLEAVDIDEQDDDAPVGAPAARDGGVELLREHVAIGQLREWVAADAVLEVDLGGDVAGGGEPAFAMRPAAPAQPAPGPVAVAVSREQLEERVAVALCPDDRLRVRGADEVEQAAPDERFGTVTEDPRAGRADRDEVSRRVKDREQRAGVLEKVAERMKELRVVNLGVRAPRVLGRQPEIQAKCLCRCAGRAARLGL